MQDEPILVSIPEAAKRLSLTEDAIRKRIRRGQLQARKVDNKWLVHLNGQEQTKREKPRGQKQSRPTGQDKLVSRLEEEVSYLKTQMGLKDGQLAAKDQQLTVKDEQIAQRDRDIQAWQEQVRYKDLLIARLEDRLIQLPFLNEPQPRQQESERGEPLTAQPQVNRNAISRFWHWFVGEE